MSETHEVNRFSGEDMLIEIQDFTSKIRYPQFPNEADMSATLKRVASGSYAKSATIQQMLDDQIVIESYALFIQDQQNEQRRIINWCQSNLEYLVGQEAENIPDFIGQYMPNRLIYVKANNAKAQILDKQRLVAQIKLDTIDSVHFGLNRVCNALKTAIDMRKRRYDTFTE